MSSFISHVIVGVIAITLYKWFGKLCGDQTEGWHLYPDTRPSEGSWYIVTMIEKLTPEMDEYITYTTSMYYLGDGIWINKTVQSVCEEYDLVKSNGDVRIYNADVQAEYLIRDMVPNPKCKRIVAWKEFDDIYIKPGVNYYGTTNRCDAYPDAINIK